MIDFWELVILALVAGVALSGWVLAELELRDAHHELDALQTDLDVALGWQERQLQESAVRAYDAASDRRRRIVTDETLVDDVAEEIEAVERELDDLGFATPWNDVHAAKLEYRRKTLERHLARLKDLA